MLILKVEEAKSSWKKEENWITISIILKCPQPACVAWA
jgi:hypothetical protein